MRGITPAEAFERTASGEEHPSDVAIVLVADGAHGLVPPEVLVHLEGCASCAVRVAEALELSLRADVALREAQPRAVAHPFPTRLFLAAIALAAVGMVPSARAATRAALEALRVLPMAAASLLGCRQKASSSECDQLIDKFAQLVVKEHFPDAGAEQIAAEQARERTEAKTDVLKNCTSEVQTNELACAMKASTSEAMIKCLE